MKIKNCYTYAIIIWALIITKSSPISHWSEKKNKRPRPLFISLELFKFHSSPRRCDQAFNFRWNGGQMQIAEI